MKVLFYSVKGAGHVNVTLPVVRSLVARGHDVLYSLTEEWQEKVEAQGARFSNLAGSGPFTTADYHPDAPFPAQILPATVAVAPRLVDEARAFAPDVIVYDGAAAWGHLVAQAIGCPAVASISTLVIPHTVELGLGLDRIDEDPINQEAIATLHTDYGVTMGWDPPSWMYGEEAIVFSAAGLSPHAAEMDARFHFVGPTIGDVDAARELAKADLEQVVDGGDGRRLVYMALGTLATQVLGLEPAFFQPVIDAVAARDDLKLLIACGRTLDPARFGALPDRVTVRSFVPQVAVLHHAAAFVTHTGANSMHEALFHNVPLLCVPCFAEQPYNARLVEELGAGVRLDKDALTAQVVGDAVDRVLPADSDCRAGARRLGDELRATGGVSQAVEVIEAAAA